MDSQLNDDIRIALPKGRMQDGVFTLLRDAGVDIVLGARAYRPSLSLKGFRVKILKPQNIVGMLGAGLRDVGFAGADWVRERRANLVDLLDTGLDPVRIVAAAPSNLLEDGRLPGRRLVIASEYERLTRDWIESRGLEADFLRSFGATEVFPPEDADCIVDNTATGSTLEANKLQIIEELGRSSTHLYASPRAMENPRKRDAIEELVLLAKSVLEARNRSMLELNVSSELLESVIEVLPCMRTPTISPLHGNGSWAVKAAVPRDQLPEIIPRIKKRGGTDIVVSDLSQIVL